MSHDNKTNENEIIEFKMIPLLERYYNEESNWGCFNFETQDPIPEFSEYIDPLDEHAIPKKMGTIAGKMQQLFLGAEYRVKAICEYNSKYKSYQYNPISIIAIVPKSSQAQVTFLKTLTSEKIANNIIAEYPNVVEDVMSGKLKDLEYEKIKGVGKKSWTKVREAIIKNYIVSDIIVMLQPLGVTYSMVKRLLRDEPNPALLKNQLECNPYIMTKIKGLGFKRVDALALKIKPELKKSNERLVSFIIYFLRQMGETHGHTWVKLNDLMSEVTNYVPECFELLDNVLKHNTFLHKEDDKIGLSEYYFTEKRVFDLLIDKKKTIIDKIKIDDMPKVLESIKKAENIQGFNYTDEQRNVIIKALDCNIAIISGKAGVGKSSIARGLLQIYTDFGCSIATCALSAKAAQRLKEATGFASSTIHRLLGVDQKTGGFLKNQNNPLPYDIILIDEASMINAKLFLDLLLAVGMESKIIICGDHMQLPPIGFGNIFSDLLNRKEFGSFQLTKPMRQAQLSGILSDANLIRDGISPLEEPKTKIVRGKLQDMYYMFRGSREALQKIAIKTFIDSVKTDGLDEVVIITPRKKDCINSSVEINKIIQGILHKNEEVSIETNTRRFVIGDKVMQISNNYEKNIFNGEVGYVTHIGKKEEGKECVEYCEVEYSDPLPDIPNNKKVVEYKKSELTDLDLAYAFTTHKIQGSGVKTVIGIIDNTHYALLDNCMLYTLITRAKSRCLLLSEPSAYMRCIKTNHNSSRQTWLSLEDVIHE